MDAFQRDFYEERRKRWRRGAFWKGFFVALILALIVSASTVADLFREASRQIARVDVSGVITEDLDLEEMLHELAGRNNVEALILRINSPGGTTAGSEALYQAVRRVAEQKPVVAVLGEMAASGGYIAALSADHIVARGNSLTGSIGVIMEYPDITQILAWAGVDVQTFRSSPFKAEPAPYRPLSPQGRRQSEALVAESFAWFRTLVAERRNLSDGDLDDVANGAVFTGRVALTAGLVDEIGGELEALAWIDGQRPGSGTLPVRTWEVERDVPLATRLVSSVLADGNLLAGIKQLTGPKLYSIGP